ncbi:DUF1361 domain-containing protein [Tenacibaculum agarivorans]|uniref:DUF1361 domain-containing protein n=1 Tax=Tenacibaculum agarivorans TaxID=1908389 RepID=UPI00094BC5FF|nr:DUF1361 domain-containing protein [Tenacibaculum agarivorans]
MIKRRISKTQSTVLILVVFCIFLQLLRVQLTQSLKFSFLLWNLFLAVIPYVISELTKKIASTKLSKFKLIFILGIWLLFLPNAPYLITDLIHFKTGRYMIWYDLFLLFTYANTGLLLAILSIYSMYTVVVNQWNSQVGETFTISVFFLSGFGVYLGRFLRFNSWDIITSPISLFKKGIVSIANAEAWYMTLGFGILLWILFSVFRSMNFSKA